MDCGLHLSGVIIEADAAHPNKMRLRGILVKLDQPSTKPPNGSQGHRILVPTEVARRRLGTLKGMGINYAPDLDGHAQRRKVGVINRAWIDGKDLRVEGHIWKHDFPEAEKDLKQPDLGMSMELGDVKVDNPHADVWRLDDFQFLGATILWRDSAAYRGTQAIAARAEQRRAGMKTRTSNNKSAARTSQGDRLATIAAQAAGSAVKESTKQVLAILKEQSETLAGIAAAQEELDGRVAALETGTVSISAEEDDAVDAKQGDNASSSSSSSEDEVAARGRKKKDDASSSSSSSSEDEVQGAGNKKKSGDQGGSSSSSSSEDEEEQLESAVDTDGQDELSDEGNAGHNNEGTKNRGNDGADDLIHKVGKTVSSARERALRTQNRQLRAQLQQMKAESDRLVHKLEKKLDRVQAQVSAASERAARKSFSPEVVGLLQKNNIDPSDLMRTGVKLTVAEVDGILASSGVKMEPEDKMAIKNVMLREGIMEEGRVVRARR